ncbi:aldehyde dehydrogenase family protein [Cupriavidus pauculus]|uniref:aldehyde dehydrogenase family protein n=1 Tax=Cupriavidus pauculus TaxID=82633 RepID=UPI001248E1D1|nr:aldehyde dehydrogenase family protein [Cupriavidus pauculus]KAB0605313.1 aldehyde dehydrogenase family protein [Cupriavidus pauculus]MCM3605224.1 aldehyde dehydrogenase family protein [Cupriavidus pauculus]UAK99677.1 aldehyde dehydrogenase family protein [Cupriavidus pauculus]
MIEWNQHFIDGQRCAVSDGRTVRIHDAATEAPLGDVHLGNARDVDQAVKAAARALAAWQRLGVHARAAVLRAVADALELTGQALAQQISREVGMPLKLAQRIQVDAPVAAWRATAALAGTFAFVREVGHSRVTMMPVGVVAAITPWNYPLHQITGKLAPALLAGCTVVLKPSELAPAAAAHLMSACEQAGMPPGVLNIVWGDGEVGEALVTHPGVQMVSFTGSTQVGRKVAALAAGDMKRVSMELGGKSPAIVLPGADLARAVKATVASCFLNAGQTCSATTRLIVPRADYPQCRTLLADAVAGMVLGDPADGATRVGPLLSALQRQRVLAHIAEAERAGFERIAGGPDAAVPGRGYFVAPTVYGNVSPDSRLATEEIFGPVLAVLCYDTVNEAIAQANGTRYGLAATVWAADDASAEAVADQLRAGQVDINGARFNAAAPFGGFGMSGVGREGGVYGLEEFLEPRAVQFPQ